MNPKIKPKLFSKEQIEWLRSNHNPEVTIKDLTKAFNQKFNESRSMGVIKHKCHALGLKQSDKSYTDEQYEWLKQNAPLMTVKETAIQFNMRFGQNRSADSLATICNRDLHLKHLAPRKLSQVPIGTETLRNGYIYVKVADIHGRGMQYKAWRPKHHIVWEEHYEKIPEEKTIIFLDKNHLNPSIENLYAVDGRVLREMSKKKWFSENPDLTLAAIKWCELFYVTKDVINSHKEN